MFLPALCRKMGVPYTIVKGKARLGAVVGRKTSSVVRLPRTSLVADFISLRSERSALRTRLSSPSSRRPSRPTTRRRTRRRASTGVEESEDTSPSPSSRAGPARWARTLPRSRTPSNRSYPRRRLAVDCIGRAGSLLCLQPFWSILYSPLRPESCPTLRSSALDVQTPDSVVVRKRLARVARI